MSKRQGFYEARQRESGLKLVVAEPAARHGHNQLGSYQIRGS